MNRRFVAAGCSVFLWSAQAAMATEPSLLQKLLAMTQAPLRLDTSFDSLTRWAKLAPCSLGQAPEPTTACAGVARVQAPRNLAVALDEAASHRLAVRIAQAATQGAEARVQQAKASFVPTVRLLNDFAASKSYDTSTGTTASVDIPTLGPSTVNIARQLPAYQVTPSVRLDYEVYNGGRDTAVLSQAELKKLAAKVDADLTVRRVSYEVSAAYLQLRKSCIHYTAATQRTLLAQAKETLAQKRLADGRIADVAYRASAAELAERRLAVQSIANEVMALYADYVAAITEQTTQPARVEDMCTFDVPLSEDLVAIQRMGTHDPLTAKGEIDVQTALAQVAVDKAAEKPKVSLYAQYAGIGRSVPASGERLTGLHRRDATVGVMVSYTLYDGYLANNKVAETLADADRVALRHEEVRNELARAKQKSVMQARNAEVQMALLRSRQTLAETAHKLAADKLERGSGAAIAVTEALSALEEAKHALAMAEVDAALVQLDVALPLSSKGR